MVEQAVSFLIAEDDDIVGRVLARKLEEHGHTEVVSTISEARAAMAARPFSAVVVDVGLPDGCGLDLVADMRLKHPSMPALVVSGRVDAKRLSEAHALGAHYLLKPVETWQIDLFAARARVRGAARQERIQSVVARWATTHDLTPAEASILELAALGVARNKLAEIRDVSPSTVKKQVQVLIEKTGDASLSAAVSRVLRVALGD